MGNEAAGTLIYVESSTIGKFLADLADKGETGRYKAIEHYDDLTSALEALKAMPPNKLQSITTILVDRWGRKYDDLSDVSSEGQDKGVNPNDFARRIKLLYKGPRKQAPPVMLMTYYAADGSVRIPSSFDGSVRVKGGDALSDIRRASDEVVRTRGQQPLPR